MKKKLLVLLAALAVAPIGQSFAKEEAWDKTNFFKKTLVKAGITTHSEYMKDDKGKAARAWGNLCCMTVPIVLGTAALGYITFRASKDANGTWEGIKKCFSKDAGEVFANDKMLAISTYVAVASGLCVTVYGFYKLIWGGKDGFDKKKGLEELAEIMGKIAQAKTDGDDPADLIKEYNEKKEEVAKGFGFEKKMDDKEFKKAVNKLAKDEKIEGFKKSNTFTGFFLDDKKIK
jgi:hypothetical protein